MSVYCICPGIHPPDLTDKFLESWLTLPINRDNLLIFPTHTYPAYSGFHLLRYLTENCPRNAQDLMMISFSAGVVGAISAAWGWQSQGKIVKGLIAFDGWGVPLWGDFPIYRVSHDEFTHWSSALLGTGKISFYADPPVDHLALWRSPQTVRGWMVDTNCDGKQSFSDMSLMAFLAMVCQK